MSTPSTPERSGWLVASAWICSVVGILLWIGPAVWRVDLFDGDAAHHIFWLYRYADPSLFPNDLSIEYFITSAPLGYRLFYAAVARVADVLPAAEALSSVLVGASLWLAWLIGVAPGGPAARVRGLAAVVATLALIVLARDTGGLLPPMAFQRSFGLPLILLCLWALQSKRYVWVGASWLGAGLFYPVVLPVLGLGAGVVFLGDLLRTSRLPPAWAANLLLAVAAIGVALLGTPTSPQLGAVTDYVQAMSMPEFGPGGRLQLYATGFFASWFRYHMTGLGWSQYAVAGIAIAAGVTWLLGRPRAIAWPAWALLLVGLALWAIVRGFAEQLMFDLYLPNRHARWAIAAFGIAALAGAAGAVFEALVSRAGPGERERRGRRLQAALAFVSPLAVVALLLPGAVQSLQRPVDRDQERLYGFLATLPADTLIASHPDVADYIPLRSRRSVLVSTEMAMPWRLGYYAEVRRRLEASFRAIYATSMDEVDRQLAPYGVDVVVTAPLIWSRADYLRPFDGRVRGLFAAGQRQGFALRTPPQSRVLFRSGDYAVIRVEPVADAARPAGRPVPDRAAQ